MNPYAAAFAVATVLGVLVDLAAYGPAVFDPSGALARFGLPAASPDDLRWVSFAAWLAVLVSWFYLPGGLAPYRFRAGAWLAVLGRGFAAGVVLGLWRNEYAALGWLQLGLFAVQLPLLVLTIRARPLPGGATP
jgi:hypothetical protein